MKLAKWNPFRLRNLALGALVLGILAGLWLGDVFKGFGGGDSLGIGLGNSGSRTSRSRTDLVNFTTSDETESEPDKSSGLVRILIDDRDYFVRLSREDRPIDLPALVKLVKSKTPNADGLRAIIDRKPSSRPSAEQRLLTALKEAGIPEKGVYLRPEAVD